MENNELVSILNTYFKWNKCRMHCFVGMLLAQLFKSHGLITSNPIISSKSLVLRVTSL